MRFFNGPRYAAGWCTLAFLLAGCLVPVGETPSVGYAITVAEQENHRGMVHNERGVIQPRLSTSIPLPEDETFDVVAWGNIDMTDSTGDAWLPNGHGGRFTKIDFIGSYSTELGGVNLEFGVHNYNLPNGLEFPFGERGATTEVYAKGSVEVLGATAEASLHYDVDEVEDYYVRIGISEVFPIDDEKVLSVITGAWLGYSGRDQSDWNYGLRESGFSDVRATAILAYQYDERTSIEVAATATKIVDSGLADWFDDIGIQKDNLWLSATIGWDF